MSDGKNKKIIIPVTKKEERSEVDKRPIINDSALNKGKINEQMSISNKPTGQIKKPTSQK